MLHFLKRISKLFGSNSSSNTETGNGNVSSVSGSLANEPLLPKYLKQYGSVVFVALMLGFHLSDVPRLFADGYQRKTKIDKSQFIANAQEAERKIAEAEREIADADKMIQEGIQGVMALRSKWRGILEKKGYTDPVITRWLDRHFPIPDVK